MTAADKHTASTWTEDVLGHGLDAPRDSHNPEAVPYQVQLSCALAVKIGRRLA